DATSNLSSLISEVDRHCRSRPMQLNLPIIEQLAPCRNILIAGMGGGFDIFCGLPICFALQERGQRVHLANLTFSPTHLIDGPTRLTPSLVGVTAETTPFPLAARMALD